MAHLALRKLAIRFSTDWLLSLPERKALMAQQTFKHFLFVNRQSFSFSQDSV
jgi:hypothetical protein